MPFRFRSVNYEPSLRAGRIERKIKERPEEVRAHYAELRNRLRQIRRRGGNWVHERPFDACCRFVEHWTRVNLADRLELASNKRRRPVNVLDDGCGSGVFLAELKEEMLRRHVVTYTTGLTREPNPALKAKVGVSIDRAITGRAEKFVPTEKYDLVWSMLGAIEYMPPLVQRDHLLKLAHALSRRGTMVVGFTYSSFQDFDPARSGRGESQLSVFDRVKSIVKALEKQGFKVKLTPNLHSQFFPENILVITRLPRVVRPQPSRE